MRALEIIGRLFMIITASFCLKDLLPPIRDDIPTVVYVCIFVGGISAFLDLVINFKRK